MNGWAIFKAAENPNAGCITAAKPFNLFKVVLPTASV